jgi:hypothetical protein
LLCPEQRLQTYKTAEINEFLKKKDLGTTVITELLSVLKNIVDPRINDVRTGTMSIVQDFDGTEYIASTAQQGSGVKSLICLCCDILTAKDATILLIDEPELGLNPAGKKAFLEFLLNQAIDKQVFIATHDPTFLNPIIWKSQPKIEVGAYRYSQSKQGFVTVETHFNEDEPSCFAGFRAHTLIL